MNARQLAERLFFLVLLFTIIPYAIAFAQAQPTQKAEEWKPSKPVKIIVPYGAGGTYDMTARVIAPEMARILGQSIYIENMPGGGGTMGASVAWRAAPDGQTLLFFGSTALLLSQYVYGGKYEWGEFECLAQSQDTARGLTYFCASPKNGLKIWADILKLKRPVRFASSGVGSMAALLNRIAANTFGLNNAIFMEGFSGMPEQVLAIIRGEADVGLVIPPQSKEYIKSGDLSAVMLISEKSLSEFPPKEVDWLPQNMDWVVKMGHPEIVDAYRTQHILLAPPKTPKVVLDALRKAADSAVRSSPMKSFYEKIGFNLSYFPLSDPAEIKRGMEKNFNAIKPYFAFMK
jgi:tripartite-type tricarboxylate transporter receptor subunit TctC